MNENTIRVPCPSCDKVNFISKYCRAFICWSCKAENVKGYINNKVLVKVAENNA